MPARDFTKKENFLFYTNICVIVFALFYANSVGGGNVATVGIRGMVHSSISQGIIVLAAGGIFLLLLGAQFCKGWNVIYIIFQILCVLGFLIGFGIIFGINCFVPSTMGEITDPDTLEGLKNATVAIKGFLDRNQDFPDLYKGIQQTLNICGFYDKEDALGIHCPYSDPDVCNSTDSTFLSFLLDLLKQFLTVGSKNLLFIFVLELVIFVIVVIAYRSIKKPNEVKKIEYAMSPTQPTYIPDNKSSLLQTSQDNSVPGMPGMPANGGYYYAQPVNSQLAKPVNSAPSNL